MFIKKYPMTCTLVAVVSLVIAMLTFVGCDSNGVATSEGITFEGRVTNETGFGKRADVEGAVVTAANLQSNGSLKALPGEAMTDAQGDFSLEVEGAADVVVLTAEKADFHSEVLVVHNVESSGRVGTTPMTTETDAEAEVYAENAARGSAGETVTVADVSAFVNKRLAAEWKAGATTTAQIAAAIEAYNEAENKYYADDDDADVDASKVREDKESSFLTLEAALNASTSASAQSEALSTFEDAMVAAYADAGASMEAQAKARQAGRAALIKFYENSSAQARFALRQQAEILTSLATAHAIEAEFEAAGASDARLNSLAELRTSLLASLRAASSSSEVEQAQADYEAGVNDQVMAELGINAALLATVETVLTPVEATLDASVASAGSASAVASAYTAFYSEAEASAETSLATSTTSTNAEMGATVLTLLTVQ